MRVRLQVRHMRETVRYDDVDYYEDRRVLDALIAAVPSEMQFSLSKKRTANEAWDAIAVAHIGSDRARKTMLHALCKEWENLTFKPGEDVALRLNTLQQKMVQFDDDTYSEERAVEKLFRCISEKYKQIARSIESLLDLFTELNSDVRGSVKFGVAPSVEIKGVGSVIFAAESGEHRLLTGVYYIPALRNSIISLA
jgi:hypothetical protein